MKKRIVYLLVALLVILCIPMISTRASETADKNYNVPPVLQKDKIILPEGPDNWKVELFGTDRKEVIGLDHKVTLPIQDVDVKLIYKLKKEGKSDITTDNITVHVNKREDAPKGANAKPNVIPTIREWAGGDGNYTLQDDSEIVVATEDLIATANVFKADLLDITGRDVAVRVGEPGAKDIYLTKNDALSTLGEEGYFIDNHTYDYISVQASSDKGIFYGTVTLLQILKLDAAHVNVPKGWIRDYPKYENRGMMLDVARKYIPMEFLNDYVKYMSWYKLSNIEVHLNDNEIFGDNANRPYPVSKEKPYYAFRLESDIKNLTSKDGSYTKDEFRQFQKTAASLGVNVIPEFDVPGHSMAFTEVRPDLKLEDPNSYQDASYDHVDKYLDVRKEGTLTFVKELFDEYLDGPDPVFVGKDVHFGTDEYANSTDTTNVNQHFVKFSNEMIKYINNKPHYSNGKVDGTYRPYLWGGFSRYGTTSADGEPLQTDATLFDWNQSFAQAKAMVDLGYDIINIDDYNLYIVPGSPVEPAYPQQLNNENLYKTWEPINFLGKDAFPSGHPQIKGGMFAIWNDNMGNGKSVADLFEVSKTSIQVISEKNWSGKDGSSQRDYATFTTTANSLADAPNADLGHKVNVKDNIVLDSDFNTSLTKNENVTDGANITEVNHVTQVAGKYDAGASFAGGSSYLKTDIKSLGFGWSAEMWINPDAGNGEDTILMESNPASKGLHTSVKLKQGKTNKIGFTVENYEHYFNYVVQAGQWTHIALTGDANGTSLYVDGVWKETLKDKQIPKGNYADPKFYETLQLPMEYIGSTTNAFKGSIDDLKIYNKIITVDQIKADAGILVGENAGNLALKKNVYSENKDYANPPQRVIGAVVDGVINTDGANRWAPYVNGTTDKDYRLTIDFGKQVNANKAVLYEKIFANPSAVEKVTVQTFVGNESDVNAWKNDSSWKDIKAYTGPLTQTGTTISFDSTRMSKIRFIIKTSASGSSFKDLSMMEIEVFGSNTRLELQKAYEDACEIQALAATKLQDYNILSEVIAVAADALTDESLNDSALEQIITNLKSASAKVQEAYRALNIAIDKKATASGMEANLDRLSASHAFDGNYTDMTNGRWSSNEADNAWLQVDLGKLERIDQVVLFWETAYAAQYKIQVSKDGVDYQDVYANPYGAGGTEVLKFEPINARYVRMQGIKRRTNDNTINTYSIFEMEVLRAASVETTSIDLGKDFKILSETTRQLTPVLLPEETLDTDVAYSSSDNAIVSVNEQGLVSAKAPGKAQIKAVLKSNSSIQDVVEVEVVPTADKTILQARLRSAEKISEDELAMVDTALREEFQKAKAKATETYQDKLASQEVVDQVAADLNTYIHAIRSNDLNALLVKANLIITHVDRYEALGKDELLLAYDEAVKAIEDSSLTYEQLDVIRVRLKVAVQQVVEIETRELLREVEKAKAYDLQYYTEESKVGFVEALNTAEASIAMPLSNENVKQVRLALNAHVNALRFHTTKSIFTMLMNEFNNKTTANTLQEENTAKQFAHFLYMSARSFQTYQIIEESEK